MPTKKLTTYTKNEPRAASEARVYAALTELGEGWHGTRAIAAALGRSMLYVADRAVLARLVASGLVELRSTPAANAPHLNRYEYRVIGELPTVDQP